MSDLFLNAEHRFTLSDTDRVMRRDNDDSVYWLDRSIGLYSKLQDNTRLVSDALGDKATGKTKLNDIISGVVHYNNETFCVHLVLTPDDNIGVRFSCGDRMPCVETKVPISPVFIFGTRDTTTFEKAINVIQHYVPKLSDTDFQTDTIVHMVRRNQL